jgi:CelD/BcsL family acetyltransferase involved in cellulose biosynthesis
VSVDIVTDAEDWDAALDHLAPSGGDDIYFKLDYARLYAAPLRSAARAELFVMRRGGDVVAMPYLVSPVPNSAFFDFETPYGYGGPLSNTQDASLMNAFWSAFVASCADRDIVAGFIRFHPILRTVSASDPSIVATTLDRETVSVDLRQSAEELWSSYSSKTRTNIRKAEKSGVTVEAVEDESDYHAFSDLYETRMAELDAPDWYRFGRDYVLAIRDLETQSRRLYLARVDGEVVGGLLVLLSPSMAHAHLSASPAAYRRYNVNAAMRHAANHDLIQTGRTWFHYGGGRTADPSDPLYRFKSGFSSTRMAFHTGAVVVDPRSYDGLCNAWREANPISAKTHARRVLRYRSCD